MYLSCLLIDVGENPDRPRPGRLWLRNLYHVHQRLCMAFPSAARKEGDAEFLQPFKPDDFGQGQVNVERAKDSGFLFRIDSEPGGQVVILVQSAINPDWDYAFQNANYLLAAPPEVKTFDPRFAKGQHLRFRIVANPTRKIDTKTGPDGQRRNGKRVPVPNDQIYEWLAHKAKSSGFSVDQDSTTVQPGYIYMNNPRDGKARLFSVRYDGVLKVTDPESLRKALCSGIGPGKAFGFGLLSLARVKE